MYYRHPPRTRMRSYLTPFLVLAFIFAVVFYGWRAISGMIADDNRSALSEKVFLNIDSGSAKAMALGKSEWQSASDKIYLFRGERVKTGGDGRASLTFFDQSFMRMDQNTEVAFVTMKKKNDESQIETDVRRGEVWVKAQRIINPNSVFSVTTDLLTIDTRGAVFSVAAPGTVYLMEGEAQIGLKLDDEIIKTYQVGVGQQFMVDEAAVRSVKRGEDVQTVFALSDSFKRTDWARWNAKKDGAVNAFEESEGETESKNSVQSSSNSSDTTTAASAPLVNAGRVVSVTSPSDNSEFNQSSIRVEGKYDPDQISAVYVSGSKATLSADGTWKAASVPLKTEGKNSLTLQADRKDGSTVKLEPLTIILDKTAPSAPVIIKPALEEGKKTAPIESTEQLIEGTVSKDTAAIIVNDYRLTKYVPGSGSFTYYAKISYGNLKAGDNEFVVYAEDKAGNRSESASITLTLDQKAIDEAAEKQPEESATAPSGNSSLPKAVSSGGVSITGPNQGESFVSSDTEFEITGTVPSATAKVSVNDYFLSLYQAGDTAFKYRAFASIGNLKIGEKNTYTVKAFDADGDSLGQASITIDVQSGSNAAPVITIPSSSPDYSTSLDMIVVGGTVGKWVTRIYLNNTELKDYIPGSEKFRSSVKLTPGLNTIVVSAEKAGEPAGEDTIRITFEP